jgi:hypothetical protein
MSGRRGAGAELYHTGIATVGSCNFSKPGCNVV